jgi:hypothetical protein
MSEQFHLPGSLFGINFGVEGCRDFLDCYALLGQDINTGTAEEAWSDMENYSSRKAQECLTTRRYVFPFPAAVASRIYKGVSKSHQNA